VVGAAAAALASLSVAPILAKLDAAEAKKSGAATRYDIAVLPPDISMKL
jgi:hypothetical protein